MKNKVIHTDNAPAAVGPYSQAVEANGKLVFVSGQLPIDPKTSEFVSNDVKEQTLQSLTNMEAILKEAGMDKTHVVKTLVLLADINDFAAMNEVYSEFFGDTKPARSAFQVVALPKGARVEIEAIAA